MNSTNKSFDVTVVMSVYNVSAYIREAVDSLISQTIGFERIQLVFVDDGSPDNSGAICEEYKARYPENVIVVHKENEGLAKARLTGAKYAIGKYITFFDPDDTLSPEAMANVVRFFDSCGDSVDVIAIPIFLFGAKSGPHPLNNKFNRGTRVIDLLAEWETCQLSLASAFVRREALNEFDADSEIVTAEDAIELVKILTNKNKLGVVAEAQYNYRQRADSNVGGAQSKPGWYITYLEHFSEWAIHYSRQKLGYLPKYIQYTVLYDLQWKYRQHALPSGVLTAQEERIYLDKLLALPREFDDDVILAQKSLSPELKLALFGKKYAHGPELRRSESELDYCYGGQKICSVSQQKPVIEFLSFEGDHYTVEGSVSLYPTDGITWEIASEIDGIPVACETHPEDGRVTTLGQNLTRIYRFCVRLPLSHVRNGSRLRLGAAGGNGTVWFSAYKYGPFSGLTEMYRYACYIRDGWCVRNSRGIVFSRAGRFTAFIYECRYLGNLVFSRSHRACVAALYRLAYHILRLVKRRPLWLISDRETEAGDNGEALFRYIVENHPEIDSWFVLLPDSPDYDAIARIGKVVSADSMKRKLLSLVSDYIISSQAEPMYYRPFAPSDEPYRDIMAGKRFVFLRHCIKNDDDFDRLKRSIKNYSGLITSSKPEYDLPRTAPFGYTDKRFG